MRTISLSWKAPERMTATSRSPARPAARVSAVAGTKARPPGASPAVKRARLGRPPSAGGAKISPPCPAAPKSSPAGPAARARAIGPSTTRRGPPRGPTPPSAPRREAVEHPHPAIAVEGGDEQVAARAAGADLRVDQRRAVEEARLGRRREPRAPCRDAVERGEVVELAAAVAPPGAREVEGAGRIHREGGRRGDPASARPVVAAESLAGHVDAGREARRQEDVGAGRGGGGGDRQEHQPQPEEPPRRPGRDHPPRS